MCLGPRRLRLGPRRHLEPTFKCAVLTSAVVGGAHRAPAADQSTRAVRVAAKASGHASVAVALALGAKQAETGNEVHLPTCCTRMRKRGRAAQHGVRTPHGPSAEHRACVREAEVGGPCARKQSSPCKSACACLPDNPRHPGTAHAAPLHYVRRRLPAHCAACDSAPRTFHPTERQPDRPPDKHHARPDAGAPDSETHVAHDGAAPDPPLPRTGAPSAGPRT